MHNATIDKSHPPRRPADGPAGGRIARRYLGRACARQPGGPSYAFFERLLPPLRYVDADFRNYPIVLSAPGSETKARLVSDGSQINALARQPNWRNENGIPVSILVGSDRELFGKDVASIDGPKLADGFLPIVHLGYRHNSEKYGEEAFAAVEPKLAFLGAVCVRFDFLPYTRGESSCD